MALTLKHDRRKRLQQKHKDRERRKLRRQLLCAAKSLKWGLDVDHLPLQRQIQLLSEYADQLEVSAGEFRQRWPDKDGQLAARRLEKERSYVLNSIAKLTVSVSRGDGPLVKT